MKPVQDILWEQFKGQPGWLQEQFDHRAAHQYIAAPDPKLTKLQLQRIERLTLLIRGKATPPFAGAYEEQVPYYGHISLSTLAAGEYGIFKVANNTDPRISNAVAPRPPQQSHIHLWWLHGRGKTQTPEPAEVNRSRQDASLLSGFIALLLDDWRHALWKLNVAFHLHRSFPRTDSVAAIRPGERWKQILNKKEHHKEQRAELQMTGFSGIVNLLFRRSLTVDFYDPFEPGWHALTESHRRYSGWWCGVLLKNDLRGLNFSRTATTRSAFSPWESSLDSLPKQLSHLIVLDTATRLGSITKIHREQTITVEKLRLYLPNSDTQSASSKKWQDFVTLRSLALDTMLDAIEARLA